MNTTELDSLVKSTFAEINRLLVIKGGEYANAEDRLANFKRGAALTGCTPLQVLFIYMSKHYDAVASFVQTSAKGEARPSSEPIEGRLDDLINYCLLAKGLIGEVKTQDKVLLNKTLSRNFKDPYAGVESARVVGVTGQALQMPSSQPNLGPEQC